MRSPISQRGLTLLELVLSLTIMSVAFIGLDSMSERFSQDTKNTLVAAHMRTFGDAVKAYVKANQSQITSTLNNFQAVLIDATTLVNSGYLSQSQATLIAGTTNYRYTNGYRQNLCSLVIKPASGPLQALVVAEGGETIDDLSLGGIAALIGGSGGSYPNTVIDGDSVNAIKGAVGSWKIAPIAFTEKTNNQGLNCGQTAGQVEVAAGRPVMALWFDTTSGLPLVRNNVGVSTLNTMTTPLIMSATNQNVGGVCAAGSIGNDTAGALLYCENLAWRTFPLRSSWQPSVARVADLPVRGNSTGDVRVTTGESYNAPYMWTGTLWQTLTADRDGTLNINALNVNGDISNTGDITSTGNISGNNLTSSGAINGASLSVTNDVSGNSITVKGSATLGNTCSERGKISFDPARRMALTCQIVNGVPSAGLEWRTIDAPGTLCGSVEKAPWGIFYGIPCHYFPITTGCPIGYNLTELTSHGNDRQMWSCVRE